VQSHVLHLAPTGIILPHIDNIEASGDTILGVSLGAPRIMTLKHKDDANEDGRIDILLESGSVYVQRGTIRYDFKHAIADTNFRGIQISGGHRLSLMLRNKLQASTFGLGEM
jgi:alkylated DNA repair protein alkB family protein 7